MNTFELLVRRSKLGDDFPLPLERAAKGCTRRPVREPLVEYGALALCDVASVSDAGGGEVLADQEPGQPVQGVVVIRKDLAHVVCRRIPVTGKMLNYVMPFHRQWSSQTPVGVQPRCHKVSPASC